MRQPTRKLRRAKRCTRSIRKATLTRTGLAGPTPSPSAGASAKKLTPGNYTMNLIATDTAGNRSKATRLSFVIVRG